MAESRMGRGKGEERREGGGGGEKGIILRSGKKQTCSILWKNGVRHKVGCCVFRGWLLFAGSLPAFLRCSLVERWTKLQNMWPKRVFGCSFFQNPKSNALTRCLSRWDFHFPEMKVARIFLELAAWLKRKIFFFFLNYDCRIYEFTHTYWHNFGIRVINKM